MNILTTRAVMATSVIALAWTIGIAQIPPPAPSNDGSFYGISSGSGSWFQFNFSEPEWDSNSTYARNHSIEYATGMDGETTDVRQWHTYSFDLNKGFTTGAQMTVLPSDGINNQTNAPDEPQVMISSGHCPYRFCIYVVFESDYGAMDTFDSFVMDRFEASTLMGSNEWSPNGPVPLILGRMTRQEQASWGINTTNNEGYNTTSASFNTTNGMNTSNGPFLWNDPRRTVWTLYPLNNSTHQVDLVMSLKQLYTLLPEYTGPVHGSGPFYSADLTDQVVIRLTAGIPSEFSGMSSILPLVVDHIGNKLVDISYSSRLLYPGLGFDGGNELQLNLKIQRRRFRASEPWLPAHSSVECQRCGQLLPRGFKKCIDSKIGQSQMNGTGSAHAVWQDLLHFGNDRRSFNVEPYGEMCFEEIMHGQWRNLTGSGSNLSDPMNNTTAAQLLIDTDAGIRCMIDTQCPIAGPGQKNDGRVVTFDHQPARARIHFEDPNYTLYLTLATTDELQDTHTTQVFSGNTPASVLKDIIISAIPGVEQWNIDLEVRKYDNLEAIAELEAENARLLAWYGNATSWTGSGSDGSNDGSEQVGSSSGPNPSPSPQGPPPPGPGRRRRLMGISSDGSSYSGSSSESDPRAPKPPQLLPVPHPRYSIELVSHNVTLGIQVMEVFTSFPVQWESSGPSLTFNVTNMKVDKFVFNPPPQGLNLEWRDPFTNPVQDPFNPNQQLPMISPDDSCSECMGAYMDCLLDTDCAYGVRTYLWGALQPSLNDSGNQTTSQSPVFIEATMTDVFRIARAYFPPRGYDKLSRYLTCLAKPRPVINMCNIDGFHRVMDPKNGSWVDKQGNTTLRLIPARVEITMNKGSLLSFSLGNLNYSWNEDGMESGLRFALLNTVLKQAQNNSFAFQLDVNQRPADDYNKVIYDVTLNNYMSDIPQFSTLDPSSNVTTWPWEVVFEGMDDNQVEGSEDVVSWNRLMDWIKVFTWYDLSGGETNSDKTPDVNPTWVPPPPQAQNAICRDCSSQLTACLSNYDCANTFRSRLSTDLNPNAVSPEPTALREQNDLFSRTIWSNIYEQWQTSVSPVTFQLFDALMQCLADERCPAGYSPSLNGTAPRYPTMIDYLSVERYTRRSGESSPITLTYQSFTRKVTDVKNVPQFCWDLNAYYSTRLDCSVNPSGSYNDVITIVGPSYQVQTLKVLYQVRRFQISLPLERPTSANIWFYSQYPSIPRWSFLLEWFAVPSNTAFFPPTNTDPCFQCQDKIQVCMATGDCWQSIQQVIVPSLRGNRGMISTFSYLNGSQTFNRADFGALLRMQPEIQSHTEFTTPGALSNFRDILECLERVQCDVSYIEGASAPPATAHSPTTIDVQAESVVLSLYVNTELIVNLDGVVTTYTEQGTGNPEALRMFLNNAIGGTVPFEISEFGSDPNGYHYTIRFPAFDQTGKVPFFEIGSNWGQVNGHLPPVASRIPWNIYFQSYPTLPVWNKLTNLLSNSNISGTMAAAYHCDACSNAIMNCWEDGNCRYMFTASALPMINAYLDTLMTFNSAENRFQVDFSNELIYNILPMASQDESKARFYDVLACHANSLCVTEAAELVAPFDSVDLVVKPARSQMQVPIGGTLNIYYQGRSFQYQDSGNTDALENLLESQVLVDTSSKVMVQRTTDEVTGFTTYLISYFGLFDMYVPHLDWPGSNGGSQDSPVEFVFKSTTPHVKEALTPWMMGIQHGPYYEEKK